MSDRHDRRHIEPLLATHFLEMTEASSDEWNAFLNEMTGLSIGTDVENATAFDAWRQALAGMGYEGVWSYTPDQVEAMKIRAKEKAERAKAWRAEQEVATKAELDRLAKLKPPLKPLPPPE